MSAHFFGGLTTCRATMAIIKNRCITCKLRYKLLFFISALILVLILMNLHVKDSYQMIKFRGYRYSISTIPSNRNRTEKISNISLGPKSVSEQLNESVQTVIDSNKEHMNNFIGKTRTITRNITRQGKVESKFVRKFQWLDLLQEQPVKFDKNFKNPCWYTKDGLRCLPYVFVIGVKKCGTTYLYDTLSKHPDFANSGLKEPQWFARRRFESNGTLDDFKHYIEMFDEAAKTILQGGDKSQNKLTNFRQITGEGSPSNLHLNSHWRELPGNENLDEPKFIILDYIHHFLPEAKLLITFRDPVERLYSDFYHEYGTLMKHNIDYTPPLPEQFHNIVTRGIHLYKECFRHHTIRSCVFNSTIYEETLIQIQLGIYYIYWEELTRLYPQTLILSLQNKDLHDGQTSMKKVFNFLGMRTLSQDEMDKVVLQRAGKRKRHKARMPMLNSTYHILRDFYQPFNKRMADLTGDPTFLYNDSPVI